MIKNHAVIPRGKGLSGAGDIDGTLEAKDRAPVDSGFRKLKPTGRLGRVVDLIVVGDVQPGCSSLHIPDGRVRLTLRFQTPKFTENEGGLQVLGTGTRRLQSVVPQSKFGFAVLFKPGGGYGFLGVPLSLLTNQSILIEEVWRDDGERYRDLLLDARTLPDHLKVLEAMFAARCYQMGTQQRLWQRIARTAARLLVQECDKHPDIHTLADRIGISHRHLRRIFETVFGLGLKEFTRVMRFQRALHRVGQQPIPDYAGIADACGFYDQSHLTWEFQELAGFGPGQFRRAYPQARSTATRDALRPQGFRLLGGIISSPDRPAYVY